MKQTQSMMKKVIKMWLLSLFCFGLFTGTASAQTSVFAPPGIEEKLSVEITPKIPGPNETTSIFIESFSANLNKSYLIWKINGITKSEGAGVTRFAFSNGPLGSVTKVSVEITTNDGRYFEKDFSFEPASANLVYEAFTYTPPFYKGKALFTSEASVKVVALPEFILRNGTTISPKNLVYVWKKDGKVMQEQSGFGKQSIVIDSPIITRPMIITAEINAIGSSLTAVQSIYIEPREPEVRLYEESLLYGTIWNKEVGGGYFMGNRNELKLIAEPYFFSTQSTQSPDLLYTWGINNEKVNLAPNQNYIGLRNDTGESGSSNVTVLLESKSKLLQSSERSMFLDFTRNE